MQIAEERIYPQLNWFRYVQSDDSSPDFLDSLSLSHSLSKYCILFQEWCPNYMLNHLNASMIQNKYKHTIKY